MHMLDDMIELRCEACGRRLKRPQQRLRRDPRVQCPNCYRDIIVPLDMLLDESERRARTEEGSGRDS